MSMTFPAAQLGATPRRRTLTASSWVRLMDVPALRMTLLAVVLAHMLDIYTTAIALSIGRPEANPLTAAVIAQFGLGGLLIEKVAVVIVTATLMADLPRRWAVAGGLVAAIVTGLAVAANMAQI